MRVIVTFEFPTIQDPDSHIAELITEGIIDDSKVWCAQQQYTHNVPCIVRVNEPEITL